MEIQEYIRQINEQFRTGNAREHSYCPMLQQLLVDMLPGFTITNEPARTDCGAPDFIITRREMPVFFIESKDRKGRTLTFDDIRHYIHIIYALTETDRLMKEIG